MIIYIIQAVPLKSALSASPADKYWLRAESVMAAAYWLLRVNISAIGLAGIITTQAIKPKTNASNAYDSFTLFRATYKAKKNGILMRVMTTIKKSRDINPLSLLVWMVSKISAVDLSPG